MRKVKEADMGCIVCANLEQTYAARLGEYIEARSSACYRVSKKFAAHKNVEMERAKFELEEHWSVCPFAVQGLALLRHRDVTTSLTQVAA
jgi:hypothetical protein